MSTVSSKKPVKAKADTSGSEGITWGVGTTIVVAIVVFALAQLLAVEGLIHIYGSLRGWSTNTAFSWLSNTVIGEFFYTLIAEALTVLGVIQFIRWRKGSLAAIGLKRPKLEDLPYAFIGLVIYIPLLIIGLEILENVFHGINPNQQQAIGFSSTVTGWPLVLVFISLVILPPIAEEILFRGFIYSGLKRHLPKVWAVLLTCILFAVPHLTESASGGALWSAGIDTFILSLTLIWLREKTGRLYAGMGLHSLKNFIAFIQLYPVIHFHL